MDRFTDKVVVITGAGSDTVAVAILGAAKAGIVGGSIEDYSGDPSNPIYAFDLTVERVHNEKPNLFFFITPIF